MSSVPCILQDNFFPKPKLNPSKSPISNLACNIPIKHNQWVYMQICSIVSTCCCKCKYCISACPLDAVKSVFHNQHVSCLAKPIFLTVDTVNSTHDIRKVFPYTHNSISIPR